MQEGYDLGDSPEAIDGEAIIAALKSQEDQRAVSEGAAGILRRCATQRSAAAALRCVTPL